MELFVANHAIGAVQDLLIDAVHELTVSISQDRLKPRGEVIDLVDHLDALERNQGRLDVFKDLLEQIDEQTS